MEPHVATSARDIGSAGDYLPELRTLPSLAAAASDCKACDLWMKGTQTVFGEGSSKADVLLVGEQPGDMEDQQGHPFVGPSGRVLDQALGEAGIDREQAYITNAVKHFNWEEMRGKRRIHKKPGAQQVSACQPWLAAEIAVVRPRVIVALGATASLTLLGRDFRLTQHRGEPMESQWGSPVVATVHPSSILRAQTADDREVARAAFVDDLRGVAEIVGRVRSA